MNATLYMRCILGCLLKLSGDGSGPNDPGLRAAISDIMNSDNPRPTSFGTAGGTEVAEFFNFDQDAYPDDIATQLRECINGCAKANVTTNYAFTARVDDIFVQVIP